MATDLPFNVRPYVNPATGTESWRVAGTSVKTGERIRKNFADAAAAHQFCNQKNAEEAGHQLDASVKLMQTRLSEADARAAEAAVDRIAGRWPLGDVIDAGIGSLLARAVSVPVAPLAEEWLKLIEPEVSDRWMGDLRARIRYFLAAHPGISSSDLTQATARAWLDGLKLHPTTKRNYRGALHKWGGWLKERGVVAVNPFSGVRVVTPKGGAHREKMPSVLLAVQAEAFMRACLTDRCRRLLGWASLCLFGGLRPLAETPHRLWSEISFPTGEISVIGRKRGARVRIFKAQPQLMEWLAVAKADKAKIPGAYSKRLRAAAIEWANGWLSAKGELLISWDEDILRHTFASYRAAQGVSVTDLAAEMGTSVPMIYSHYRHPRTAEEAWAFQQITPARLNAPTTASS